MPDNYQTEKELPEYSKIKSQGLYDHEYQIYKAAAELRGWPVKTYEEWLES